MRRTFRFDPLAIATLAGAGLLLLTLAPPLGLMRALAGTIGAEMLFWAFAAAAPACGVVAVCCAALARRARKRGELLKGEYAKAWAMAASFYPTEELEGELALSGLGQKVEHERAGLFMQSALLALAAAVFAAAIIGVAALAWRSPGQLVRCAEAISVCALISAMLTGCAHKIRAAAMSLEPTPEQIRAGLVRQHERQEAELRAARMCMAPWPAAVTPPAQEPSPPPTLATAP
jgi:hypothetical protein